MESKRREGGKKGGEWRVKGGKEGGEVRKRMSRV